MPVIRRAGLLHGPHLACQRRTFHGLLPRNTGNPHSRQSPSRLWIFPLFRLVSCAPLSALLGLRLTAQSHALHLAGKSARQAARHVCILPPPCLAPVSSMWLLRPSFFSVICCLPFTRCPPVSARCENNPASVVIGADAQVLVLRPSLFLFGLNVALWLSLQCAAVPRPWLDVGVCRTERHARLYAWPARRLLPAATGFSASVAFGQSGMRLVQAPHRSLLRACCQYVWQSIPSANSAQTTA